MDELMLKIENVSKEYKLGQIGGTTLRDELQRLRAKILKKEDPTKRIGTKDYNKGEKFMALKGVSLDIKTGERVGIIGHNGAGKSTLLKLLSRVTAPTEGTISLNGRIASMLEVGTGFHPELTGRENIYMNGAILGMTKKEIDAKMEDIIEFSEVRQFIDTPVKRYSSGMYVKLAFSVAAHLDSEIMIMDEVLAVGDMKFQQKCLNKMSDVSKQKGRTILYVSHNMNTIRQLCDRVVVLDHGEVVFDGDVEKGINIYLGANVDSKIDYVYAPKRDGIAFEKREAVLLGLHVLEREESIIKRNENIKFIINGQTHVDCDNLRIRFEIRVNGNIVGTSLSDKSFSVKKGNKFEICCCLDTTNFVVGSYHVDALIYTSNKQGAETFYDKVINAMSFDIIDDPDKVDIIWLPQYWGHVRFNDLKLTDINIF